MYTKCKKLLKIQLFTHMHKKKKKRSTANLNLSPTTITYNAIYRPCITDKNKGPCHNASTKKKVAT